MLNFAQMNQQKVSEMIGREIPADAILMAKNVVLGMDRRMLPEFLGLERAEVEDILASQDYKDTYTLLAAVYNQQAVDTDATYDSVESRALSKLSDVVDHVRDPDLLLRIAATMNRATRRQRPQLGPRLDSTNAAERVNLTLTERMIQKFTGEGETNTRIQEISISKMGALPNYDELRDVLNPNKVLGEDILPDRQNRDVESDADVLSLMKKYLPS